MILRALAISMIGLSLAGCAVNDNLSGDVYTANQGKQIQTVTYGTIVHIRPIQIQGDEGESVIGTLGGAILGGLVGNTIGGGGGRSIATAAGALAGGVAGKGLGGLAGRSNGVELEIRTSNGQNIIVVQKLDKTQFAVGQRVAIARNGNRVTVSPR